MFKILLATDGSDHAAKATDQVKALCQKITDAQVTVVSVVDTGAMIGLSPDAPQDALPTRGLHEAASGHVSKAKWTIQQTGRPVETRVALGKPADIVCDIADREHFDLVVVGSRGHGGITGALIGSVSNKIIQKACAPVLVVR